MRIKNKHQFQTLNYFGGFHLQFMVLVLVSSSYYLGESIYF